MTITEFIEARLAEDEAAAKAATRFAEWQHDGHGQVLADGGKVAILNSGPFTSLAAYAARFDPARALRDVAAKRKILTRYEFACNQVAVGEVNEQAGTGPADAGWPLRADSHMFDVLSLASVWSDHPGYDPEWQL